VFNRNLTLGRVNESAKKIEKIKRQGYLKVDQPTVKSGGDLKTTSAKTALPNRAKLRPFFRIMAPFKLFRTAGSTSRSTSQENEPDQPATNATTTNLVVTSSLNKLTTAITSSAHNSYINIDDSDPSENSSLMSLNNDQRALLSAGSTADQIGNSFFYLSLFLPPPLLTP
jgi:hypothetical protein